MTYVRPSKYLPDHPLAGKNGKVLVSRLTLFAQCPEGGPCHWCGSPLSWSDDLVADHLDSDPGNNAASNVVVSCRGCNANRSDGTGHGRRDMTPKPCANCGAMFVARRENHARQECCSRACSMSLKPRAPTVDHPHGTEGRYRKGCKCEACRSAHAARARARRAHSKVP